MKISLEACTQCKKLTAKIFTDGRCRACYEVDRNEALVHEIAKKFSGAGTFNDLIFRTCLNDLKQFRAQRRDVRELTRIAGILSQYPISPPRSWPEARLLSARLAIRYSINLSSPSDIILRIAKELEETGGIDSPDLPFAKNYEKALAVFDPAVKQAVMDHLNEVAKNQKSRLTSLTVAMRLGMLQDILKGECILNPSPEVARAYFKSKPLSIATTRDTLRQFNRFYRWSIGSGLTTKNPFDSWRPEYMRRTCEKCGKTSIFNQHDRFCDTCHLNTIYLAKLNRLAKAYQASTTYNQHLFDLYVRYVKRSQFRSRHLASARAFVAYLESHSIPVIRSWRTVIVLSEDFSRGQRDSIKEEYPFVKIGKMLQELGVLPIRETDKEGQIENLYARCSSDVASILRRYDQQLIQTRHSMKGRLGTIRMIFELQHWLILNEPTFGLFTMSQLVAIRYLAALNDGDRRGIRRQVLSKFYRWAKLERLTLINPFQGIPVPKPAISLCVCSDEQIRLIERYVKNLKSDPEYAFILTLVLYWGVTTRELAMSSIEIYDYQIWINIYRPSLSLRRHRFYRDQILKLPLNPPWLTSLQKRYIQLWRGRFDHAKKTFPNQPLLLKRLSTDCSVRPMSLSTVIDIFCRATIAATGQRITPNVVRRTSGHIHVDCGDASRLTRLGWSRTRSNDFSYRNRTYFSPGK